MKKHIKREFYLPTGLTGKEFEKFLKRTNMHFISPKKKTEIDPTVEALHKALNSAILNEKAKKGLLIKI
jgi:hypothetical protein